MSATIRRKNVPEAPAGRQRLKWLGPGLLWMVSSVGSGSVLFTPRVGARYGYEFLWLAILFCFFMWVMIREVGRYTVVTGKTIFEGYGEMSGPSKWPLYFILIPQLLAAVVTISGISALAASALMIAVPVPYEVIAVVLVVGCLLLVVTGQYKTIERVTSILAIALVLVVVVSASRAFDSPSEFLRGAVPGVPDDVDFDFIVPWVGFILAGASGIMWFSYWVSARNFGGKVSRAQDVVQVESEADDTRDNQERYGRLRGWEWTLTNTSAVAVVGGFIVLTTFLVLGAELLRPEGLIPEGITVAEDLTKLLSGIWGEAGKWLLIVGIMIALLGTILSCQDGYGRMFADGTLLIAMPRLRKKKLVNQEDEVTVPRDKPVKRWLIELLTHRDRLRIAYILLLGGGLPLLVFFLVKDPVEILSVAGTVAAVHTPVVVFLTLYLNRKYLPASLKPSVATSVVMAAAGLAYGAFAVYHFATLGQGG